MPAFEIFNSRLRGDLPQFDNGQIIKSKISINKSILSTTLLSRIPVTRAQRFSILSMDTMSRQGGTLGRERPCVYLSNRGGGAARLAPLTALDGFDPILACGIAQHYLVPVNSTPALGITPRKDAAPRRVLVEPSSLWPSSDHGYVLAVMEPVPKDFVHSGLVDSIEGEPTSFRVSEDDVLQIIEWNLLVSDTINSWSTERKLRMAETAETHRVLLRSIRDLDASIIKENGARPEDLQALDEAYDDHMRAIARANYMPRPVSIGGIPPQCLPEHSDLRWFIEVGTLRPFDYEHRQQIETGTADEQESEIKLIRSAVDQVRTAEPDRSQEFDILVRIFDETIKVALLKAVHPAFKGADSRRLPVLLRNDTGLCNALRRVWNKQYWILYPIINYVQQPAKVEIVAE